MAVELAQTFVLIDKQVFLLRSAEGFRAIVDPVQVVHNHHQSPFPLLLQLGDLRFQQLLVDRIQKLIFLWPKKLVEPVPQGGVILRPGRNLANPGGECQLTVCIAETPTPINSVEASSSISVISSLAAP